MSDPIICGAAKRDGTPCRRKPMQNGRCPLHGGKSLKGMEHPSYKHGLYSKYAPALFKDKIEAFIEADPLDLTNELALTRALLAEFLNRFADGGKPDAMALHVFSQLINDVRKTVEAISKIRNDTALTAAELTFLAAKLSDMVVRYIDDPVKREAFVSEFFTLTGTFSQPEYPYQLSSSRDE